MMNIMLSKNRKNDVSIDVCYTTIILCPDKYYCIRLCLAMQSCELIMCTIVDAVREWGVLGGGLSRGEAYRVTE